MNNVARAADDRLAKAARRPMGNLRIALLSSTASVFMAMAAAHAQTTAAPSAPAAPTLPAKPGQAAPAATVETVVVTANKVRSTLQKTPQAVTVLSGVALDRQNVAAPRDLDNIIPGLVVNTTPSNPLSISIRGAGYEGIENTSAQPGVSYNQDGVYIASPISLNANFLDVESVEVLRGPQGTVLGQNSDGGAINVTTVKPVLGAYNGSVETSGGSYGYDRFRGTVNLPFGDTFAVRLAVQQEAHDGWSNATQVPGTGGKYPLSNEDSVNGRIDALWKPIEPLTIELWGEHYTNNTNGDAFKNLLDPNPDPRELTQDYPTKLHQRADNFALNVAYDLDWSTAKFIGSYQEGSLDSVENLDKLSYATALPILGVHDIDVANNRDGHSYTAEFDLASKPGGRFEWIAGAFYLQQTYNEAVLEYQYNNSAANMLAYEEGLYNTYAAFGLPTVLGANNPYASETAGFSGPVAFETRDTQKLYSASAYAQGTYHITNELAFLLGVRGTLDNQIGVIQDYFGIPDRNSFPAGATQSTQKSNFQKATGRAELVYTWAPTNSLYGMVSNGIKPGGANLNPQAVVIPTEFAPERVDAFEIGSKNEFFGRTLRINVSAFYNMIHDFQLDSEDPIPFQGGLTNIKSSHVQGVEAEATQLLPYNLRLDGNLTVQGSKVDSHQQLLNPSEAEQIDIANGGPFNGNDVAQRFAAFYSSAGNVYGHALPKVPPFTANIALQHTLFLESGRVVSGIHLIYRNPYYFRVYADPTTDLVPAQRQIDLNFSYITADNHWHADFLVTNLTNNASVNSRYSDNFGTFITANYYVPPREIIGRIGYRF